MTMMDGVYRTLNTKFRMDSPVHSHTKTRRFDGLSGKTVTIMEKRSRSAGSLRSVVYSRGRRTEVISFPSDYALHSRLAVELWNERPLRLKGVHVDSLRKIHTEASSLSRVRVPLIIPTARAIEAVETEVMRFGKDLSAGLSGFELGITFPDFGRITFPTFRLSPERAMYAPLLGAVVLGMGSALFIEHSFGSGAHAGEANVVVVERPAPAGSVLGTETVASSVDSSVATELGSFTTKDVSQEKFETKVREMVKGYPVHLREGPARRDVSHRHREEGECLGRARPGARRPGLLQLLGVPRTASAHGDRRAYVFQQPEGCRRYGGETAFLAHP